MKIIVALGNVGPKYENTRHNAGFIMLDRFLAETTAEAPVDWKEEKKLFAHTAKVPHNGQVLFLAKPTTLMNLSGKSVSAVLNFFKEPIENLIVIYDDVDLPLGTIRVRDKGSAGTHNGMKSIIEQLGTQDFTRIRIGIESRGEHVSEHQALDSFVLSDFTEPERKILDQANKEAITALKNLLT